MPMKNPYSKFHLGITFESVKRFSKLLPLTFQTITVEKDMIIDIIELPHDKTNKMACAPSKDRSACVLKLVSLATHWEYREDSDQIVQMPRLIWVFAGSTGHFVGSVMKWLIFSYRLHSTTSLDQRQRYESIMRAWMLAGTHRNIGNYYCTQLTETGDAAISTWHELG